MAVNAELAFGTDNFNNQKILNEVETLTQLLINVLVLKPGQLPGLPHLGMNIKQYIYKTQEEINIDDIKSKLRQQCSMITPYIDIDSMMVILFPYNNESILYISIPFTVRVDGYDDKSLLLGFKKRDKSNDITFNYKISNTI